MFVSDPDPCLHNTLSRRDVGTKHYALVPGEMSLVSKHSVRLLEQTLVPDLGTRLCVCEVCLIFILHVADVMPAGCP